MNRILSNYTYPDISEISIKKVKIEGWLHESNRNILDKYIKLLQPKIILELGVWKGLSTIYMTKLFDDVETLNDQFQAMNN